MVQRYLRMVENFAMLHYSLLQRAPPENHCVLMAASLKLLPGSTVRWRGRRYLIVDYQSLDAIIARQPGKRRLERIPVNEAAPDHASHIVSGRTPDLVSVPEMAAGQRRSSPFSSRLERSVLAR